MLRIREAQFHTLERAYDASFVADLDEELRASYPEVFDPLPVTISNRMIERLVRRAEEERGLSDEGAIRHYLHYCAAVGPDFDDQGEIRSAIEEGHGEEEERLASLCEEVSEEAWDEADESTDMTRWFDGSEQGRRDCEVSLLAWALPERMRGRSEEEVVALLDQAGVSARALGFQDRYDVLTVAACMVVYGTDYSNDERLAWKADVFDGGHAPATVAELLRLRVLLDTGHVI